MSQHFATKKVYGRTSAPDFTEKSTGNLKLGQPNFFRIHFFPICLCCLLPGAIFEDEGHLKTKSCSDMIQTEADELWCQRPI